MQLRKSIKGYPRRIISAIFLCVIVSIGTLPMRGRAADLPPPKANRFDQAQEDLLPDRSGSLTPDSVIDSLTEAEREWLREHPVIRVVQDPAWPPIEFVDGDGRNQGITSDYLDIIERRLGVKFERVGGLSWQEAYARLKRWEIDMTTSVTVTPERGQFWTFTSPYIKIPVVILTRSDVTYIPDMRRLEGKTVAVVDGYAVCEWIPRDFPGIQLIKVNTAEEGIDFLQKGKAFAFLDNMLVIGYYLSKLTAVNLKIAGETPYANAQAMAVRKDWGIFAEILQKALDSISNGEREEIYQKWVPIRYEHGFDYRALMQTIFIFALIVLGLAAWNQKMSREIKQRKEAEAALSQSEERLRLALDGTTDGIWDCNMKSGELYFSPRYYTMLGYEPNEFPATYENWRSLIHPEDVEKAKGALRGALKSHTPFAVEFRLRRKDGGWGWIMGRGKVAGVDEAGAPTRMAGSHTDITERKQAELALAEEEMKRRILIDRFRDGIVVLDQEGAVCEVNRSFAEMLGYSPEEVLRLHVWDWNVQWTREELKEQLQAIDQTGSSFGTCHRRKDGTVYDVEISTNGMMWGARKLVFCVCRDISARKAGEQALRESEERFRILVENAPDGIFLQTNHRLAYLNRAALKLFSAESAEQLLGQPILSRFHESCHDNVLERIRQLNVERLNAPPVEELCLKLDGTTFYAEVSAAPITYRGEPGAVVFLRDIAERKRVEEERERLESQLRNAQKLESMGTLAAGIAHDFNNILLPIIGYSEMALNELTPSHPLRFGTEQVLKAAHRARDLVKQILTFSQMGREAERRPSDLSPIVNEAMHLLRASLPTSIEIRKDLKPGIALVDPVQIHQVIMNLCTNAAHAMDGKGVLDIGLSKVFLNGNDPVLASNGMEPGIYVNLRIEDSGCGMDAAIMERIFDPYFTTKEVGKGSGLGLAVVHGIVRRHEGAITVRSKPGKGSVFNIFLPELQSEMSISRDNNATWVGGSERILLVDDETSILDLGVKALGRMGYKVTAERDSMSALEIFLSNPGGFDLIITDYTMPNLTGEELIAQVRQIRTEMPIILSTGFSEKVTENTKSELGVEIIMKPYGLRQLAEAIRKALASGC